jgi:hypothetical protein
VQPQPGYLQVRTTESQFRFIADNDHTLFFQLAYRTPGRDHKTKNIRIFINGNEEAVAVFPLSKKWTTGSFTVRRGMLVNGINKLEISWPFTPELLEVPGKASANAVLKAMFPVLGEVYSFFVADKEASNYDKTPVYNQLEEIK